MLHVTFAPAHVLAAAMRSGDLSPHALMEATLVRIARLNPVLNAFVALRADAARAHEGLQKTKSVATAPARSGHVYLVRIAREGKPDILVKLLVLEFRPGESVTFRWQQLEG